MGQGPKPTEMVAARKLPAALEAIATVTPALTRLEPQSVSGDPAPGAEAVVADPLWMLGRQWQIGELLGRDAGSPVSVTVSRRALPITAWAPLGDGGDEGSPDWRPWPEGALLDELVEHTPHEPSERGLRWRAESGAQLAEMLREGGHGDAAEALLEAHPLEDAGEGAGEAPDPAAQRLLLALAGAAPDGGAARAALEAGDPPWLAAASDAKGARAVAAEWLRWAAGPEEAGGAWTTTRLEHRFLLRFGHGKDAAVLRATAFGHGSARWGDFEWVEDAAVSLDGDGDLPATETVTDTMLATPLRFPGMPADRYWQLEDGSVDVAALEAQPHDLARLCLAEFALGGDDWLVVPVDGRRGAVNQVESVSVTTTFGERLEVGEAAHERREAGFRMYEVTSASGASLEGIVLPPVAQTPLLGEPVEEVAFLRDETANMAWAVERVVPGRSGDPRQRSAEPQPQPPEPGPDHDPEDLLYELLTPTPRHWIPLVPVRRAPATIALRKGALLEGRRARPAARPAARADAARLPGRGDPPRGRHRPRRAGARPARRRRLRPLDRPPGGGGARRGKQRPRLRRDPRDARPGPGRLTPAATRVRRACFSGRGQTRGGVVAVRPSHDPKGTVRQIRQRLTYANVAATLALFLAVGGATAIAASRLPRNSVGPRQLQPNAVRTGQLGRNAVRTGKIAFEAVRAGKIAKDAVVTNRLRDGAVSRAKLFNQAVGTGQLGKQAVNTSRLGNESVQTGKIGSGAITTGKLADDSVTGPKVKESTLDEVPSAAEAAKVGGYSAACPAATTAIAGLCFDAAPRASAEWLTAAKDCADEGRVLPSVGQLLAAATALGNVNAASGEWTDSFYVTSTPEERAIAVNGLGALESVKAGESLPYRCVTQLLR